MKNSTSLLSILAGAATGALLGMLFAPKKGTKFRKDISRRSSEYARGAKDGVADFFHDVSDELLEARDNALKKFESKSSQITKDLVKNFKERVH